MGINPPPPTKKKATSVAKQEEQRVKFPVQKENRAVVAQRAKGVKPFMRSQREKGDQVFLERLGQFGFRDSGSEITGCGSSEISSDQRTDQTTEQAAGDRKLWSGREIGGKMVGRVLHNPEENLGLFFWVAPPNPRVGLKIE